MKESEEIIEGYNPLNAVTFAEGECPFGWHAAQVRAINHFGHNFCINPFYDNMRESFYGWEFKSTDEMLERLTGSWQHYKDMTVKSIIHLKQCCDIEFPNKWGEQFHTFDSDR